jgi:nitrogen regulatory protein P-II 1
MKLIVAVIQPDRLESVKEELSKADVRKMTVSRVKGCGQQGGYSESYRGQVKDVNLLDKIRVEIFVSDEFEQITIDAIVKGARSGNIGDGKIIVTEISRCVRIRTGEEGEDAIG